MLAAVGASTRDGRGSVTREWYLSIPCVAVGRVGPWDCWGGGWPGGRVRMRVQGRGGSGSGRRRGGVEVADLVLPGSPASCKSHQKRGAIVLVNHVRAWSMNQACSSESMPAERSVDTCCPKQKSARHLCKGATPMMDYAR